MQMRAIQENEMAEPGPRGLWRGLWGRQQSRSHKVTMHTNPSTPGCPAWRALELPLAQCGPPRGHSRALGPGRDPDSQTLGGSCSLPQPGWRASRAAPTASSTPRQVPPTSPPPASLAAAPTPPCQAPTSHPRRNLLVRVCFFGHFLVHLDACPAAGSLAPFIFLCARPPSSHLRHLLIWWWRGELEMKGAPRQAEKRRSPSAGRGLGRGAPGSGCHRPAGRGPQALNGRRGEIWEGDPEG